MSTKTVLLVIIDTPSGGTVKRRMQLPPLIVEIGMDNRALMRRAEQEAKDIGIVRSIELTDAEPNQKTIPWGQP